MSKLLSLILVSLLFSCSLSSHGLDEEELNIVIPTEEVSNIESKVIAHRGAWRETGQPQNSLAAFQKALDMDIYGSECDVRQTKDGRLVVCHDATYAGLTISKTDYATLSQHLLENGEPLPLLDEFLISLSHDTGKVRLVIELKSCSVDKLLLMVDSIGVLNRVDFISFSQNLCDRLIGYGFGYKTLFLSGSLSPETAWNRGYGGIDYSSQTFDIYPDWIDEAINRGMQVWVWTVNGESLIQSYLEQGVFVTTDIPGKARELERTLHLE
ncbi:MAG: hypothetical protein IKT00_09030 [Prevotella sp.]|nr:hypothetical protein [Prevotella sp.]